MKPNKRIRKKLSKQWPSRMSRFVVQQVRPEPGDMVFIKLRDPMPLSQLRAFRRHLYELGESMMSFRFEPEGTFVGRPHFIVINVPGGVDIQHLSQQQCVDIRKQLDDAEAVQAS